jgi:hypothetical protein
MIVTEEILSNESPRVSSMFSYWRDEMYSKLKFWTLDDGIDIHTEGHCERVLLLALKIGEKRQLLLRSMIALCHASIFHDTRRKDNYLDRGHGDRAADYYKEFCEKNSMKFLPEVFATIKYHDRNDEEGEEYIRREAPADEMEGWLEVYRDFKDADALDRFRLGPWGLNESFLRTEQSRELVDFARELVDKTIDPDVMKKTMDATRPFADKLLGKKK